MKIQCTSRRYDEDRQHPHQQKQTHQATHDQQHHQRDETTTVRTRARHTHDSPSCIHKHTYDAAWPPKGTPTSTLSTEIWPGQQHPLPVTTSAHHSRGGRRWSTTEKTCKPTRSMARHRDAAAPTDASYLHGGELLNSDSCYSMVIKPAVARKTHVPAMRPRPRRATQPRRWPNLIDTWIVIHASQRSCSIT